MPTTRRQDPRSLVLSRTALSDISALYELSGVDLTLDIELRDTSSFPPDFISANSLTWRLEASHPLIEFVPAAERDMFMQHFESFLLPATTDISDEGASVGQLLDQLPSWEWILAI